ncbi:MAG TPA: hypothetical protein VEW66_04435, partial [Thermomicrobiales bacterium]|nr:hypothetical protein [Thermomicrobiales bacterium]
VIDQPLFRGANADLNMTLAMALVFFACWIVWGLQELGPLGFLKELFAPKGESAGLMRVVMVIVFFAVGCLQRFPTCAGGEGGGCGLERGRLRGLVSVSIL